MNERRVLNHQTVMAGLVPEKPVLIAGPTASGKSALALRIAAEQGGVIVNADANTRFSNTKNTSCQFRSTANLFPRSLS